MLKNGKSLPKVEKRGGMRKVVKRQAKKAISLPPTAYYQSTKGSGIFPKRLGQYRFLICTDLETDDMAALAMFTAWVKTNEQFFDARNSFPIYGFLVGETTNQRIKAQRAREFLHLFGDILAWDDDEHHLYNGYTAAGRRVWFDGESNKAFENEDILVENQEALTSDDYPDPEPFVTTVDELLASKASNLFVLYLKPLRFFQSLRDRPEIFEYLRKAPGAMYGSFNVRSVLKESPELQEVIMHFLNRTAADAPLLYTESHLALGEANTVNADIAPRLFRELDESEDEELAKVINDTMFTFNDSIMNRQIGRLQDAPEFEDVDFEDLSSFTAACEKLSPEREKYLHRIIKIVRDNLQTNSRQFVYADPLAIIAMLVGCGTLTDTPFKLQRATLEYSGQYITSKENGSSNTRVLVPKGALDAKHVQAAQKLLENMLLAAFKITND